MGKKGSGGVIDFKTLFFYSPQTWRLWHGEQERGKQIQSPALSLHEPAFFFLHNDQVRKRLHNKLYSSPIPPPFPFCSV